MVRIAKYSVLIFSLLGCIGQSVGVGADEIAPQASDDPAAPGLDLQRLESNLAPWQPTLWNTWERGVSAFSALCLGPGWADAVSVGNQFFQNHPPIPVPSLTHLSPTAKVVAEVIEHKDVIVPSNVMYIRLSKHFLEKYFCRSIKESSPVRDTMLGAAVTGTRHTTAATELTLLPNTNRAEAKIRFVGDNHFTTVSRKDGVQIYSRGTTHFSAETILTFDGTHVTNSPVVVSADTHTTTTNIDPGRPGLRGRIALRIASAEEAGSHAQAEAITSERTKVRVEKGFEARLKQGLDMLTDELKTQYAKLPFEGRFALQEIRCNTTPTVMELVLIGRGDAAPNFVDPPKFLAGDPDIEFQMHASLVQKAILDPALRATLQSAVTGLVDRPLLSLVAAARQSKTKAPDRELKIHWMEGQGEWLALGWHAGEDAKSDAKKQMNPRERVSVRVRR